jgi:hypothetical protein
VAERVYLYTAIRRQLTSLTAGRWRDGEDGNRRCKTWERRLVKLGAYSKVSAPSVYRWACTRRTHEILSDTDLDLVYFPN